MTSVSDCLQRGFYLFPVRWKVPCVKWKEESSNDPAKIVEWQATFPTATFAIDLGKSGLCVLDDDSGKKPAALANLGDLVLEHGPFETFTVKTRSGGHHYYFRGDLKNTQGDTRPGHEGLDTRGAGGYVVAPCAPGYEIEHDVPIQPLPQWLADEFGSPTTTTQKPADIAPVIPLDRPSSIDYAVAYLETAPVAIEGQGGDATTYKVACRTKDFGLSQDTTLDLLSQYWNDRCLPPWSPEDLERKVANAYQYGTEAPGIANPESAFSNFIDTTAPRKFLDINELMHTKLTLQYLIRHLIETPSTGLIFGDPSAGKSFAAIDLGLSVATGSDWMLKSSKPGLVVYFAGEGRQGITRRAQAWCKYHNREIPDNHFIVSATTVAFTPETLIEAAKEIKEIERACKTHVALIIIDTLARHMPPGNDENSAKDMGEFINMADWLRDQFDCVAAVVHHSGKMNKASSRGSSALRGALDWEVRVSDRAGIRVIEYTKQKEGELPAPMSFKIESIEIGVNDDGDPITSGVPVPCAYDPTGGRLRALPPDVQLAFSVLQFACSSSGRGSVPESAWRGEYMMSLGDGFSDAAKRQKFARSKKKLLEEELIAYDGDKVRENSLGALETDIESTEESL